MLTLLEEYVDQLMNWVQGMLDDEAIFPSKIGTIPPARPMITINCASIRRAISSQLSSDSQEHRSPAVQSLCPPLQPPLRPTLRAEYRGYVRD